MKAVHVGRLSVLSPQTSVLQAKRASFLIALSLALAGCGYQFQVEGPGPTIGGPAAGAVVRETAPRLLIPKFVNRTLEPNLEIRYTTYARREFAAGSGARIVQEQESADLVLKAAIVSVSAPSLTFSRDATFESRVIVRVAATVEDVGSGKVVWKDDASGHSEFFLTNDLQFNRVLKDRALEQAGLLIVQDLAVRFLSHLERQAAEPPSAPPPPSASGHTGQTGRP